MDKLQTSLSLKSKHDDVKKELEKIYGEEEFIATFMVYSKENDYSDIFSTCTWTKTVDTIFPHSQYISLIDLDSGENIHFLPMNKFLKIEGVKVEKIKECESLGLIYYKGISYPEIGQLKNLI